MSKSILANKIGRTLFNIAKDKNILSVIDNDLTQCVKVISQEKDFVTLMNNPNIEKEKKCQIIDASFTGVDSHIVNVIKILANNLQVSLIADVLETFTETNNLFLNQTKVKVESVYKLSEEELDKLALAIKGKLGVDKVEIENTIDHTLIGGLKISYNGKVIDSSIKAKIKDMQRKISTF